jgi:hypothetical protein
MKLIDIDKVIAEIKKLKGKVYDGSSYCNGWQHALRMLEIELATLETKEVDLEEEIDKIWNPRFNLGWDEKSLLSINHEGFITIAKHFYELGLNKGKGE